MDNRQTLHLLEVLDELEKQRKVIKGIFIAAIICMASYFLLFFFDDLRVYAVFYLRISFIVFIGLCLLAENKRRIYSKQFKSYVIEYGINRYFDNARYYRDRGLDSFTVYSTGMLRKGNVYESEDLLEGEFNGVPFSQADVRVRLRNGKSKYTSKSIDLFMGRWMIFRFNKNFVGNLQIIEKGFFGSKKGRFTSGEKLKPLELDDEQFNSTFRVFCQNEQEAYYILTPQMMRRMLYLKENTDGQLMFCFVNNALHIACNNRKNSFEAPIFNKIDLEKIINETYKDLSLITDFIKELNLENNLFRN
jgi:hypothetical protein